jgi:hypothetical protein
MNRDDPGRRRSAEPTAHPWPKVLGELDLGSAGRAGVGSRFPDDEYATAAADLIVKVKEPVPAERPHAYAATSASPSNMIRSAG